MNCKEFSSELQLYVDDELPDAALGEVQKHLAVCPECHTLYESSRLLKNLLKEKIIRRTATQTLINDVRESVMANA